MIKALRSIFRKHSTRVLLGVLLLSGVSLGASDANQPPWPDGLRPNFTAFGPHEFLRPNGKGEGVTHTEHFTVKNPAAAYVLKIEDGDSLGQFRMASDATVWLNGVQIAGEKDFEGADHSESDAIHDGGAAAPSDAVMHDDSDEARFVTVLRRVHPEAQNTLMVRLEGRPRVGLRITLVGVDHDLPVVTATPSPAPNAAGWNNTDVTVAFAAEDATSNIVQLSPPVVQTSEGLGQLVSGTATDEGGNVGSASLTLKIDKTAPQLSALIDRPVDADGFVPPGVVVTFQATDALSGVASVSNPVTLANEGIGQLVAGTALDVAGNSRTLEVTLNVRRPLTIPTAPIVEAFPPFVREGAVDLSGRVDGASSLEVAAPTGVFTVPVAGNRFTAHVPLELNAVNHISFTGIGTAGRGLTTTIQLTSDSEAPTLAILFPASGAEIFRDSTDVAGRVSDMLSGFNGLTVQVNGVEAVVDVGIGTNGTFLARGVPLVPGQPTVLTATARDVLGNERSAQLSVTRGEIPAGAPRMELVAGDHQMNRVMEVLQEQVAVRLTQGDGSPFANKIVDFRVVRSDGELYSDTTVTGVLRLQVRSDANGIARAFWRVGSDAGCGNNRLEVSSTDVAGTFIVCASSTPAPPKQINIGSGNNQKTEVGAPALEPLRAWVSDGCNGGADVSVKFRVVAGGGKVNGEDSVTVRTSRTGHASANFTLGPDPGNNEVEATFPDQPDQVARFTAVGLRRDTTQPTRLAGLVLDNASRPIGGVQCTVIMADGTEANGQSDEQGQFHFTDLQSGPAKLHVDGLPATTLSGQPVPIGSFPALTYELFLVPNAENSLPTPVLLPPLDPRNARAYSTRHDVELTVEGMEGLRMLVRAGSMRLPNGQPAPDGTIISLNQVHHDDVPMPMPDGAAPPFAWTLQPGGSHFDPPVSIIYPNMSGLMPGAIAYFLSFNHGTGRFEIVAPGSVTADGLSVLTDPGTGISIAGWGCNCPPYSVTASCRDCPPSATSALVAGPAECDPCRENAEQMQRNYEQAQGTAGAGFAHQLACLAKTVCGGEPSPCTLPNGRQNDNWQDDQKIRDVIADYTKNFGNNPFQATCQTLPDHIPAWLSSMFPNGSRAARAIGRVLNINDVCAMGAGLLYHFPFELLPGFVRNCPLDSDNHNCFLTNAVQACFGNVDEFSPLMQAGGIIGVPPLAAGLREAVNFLCPVIQGVRALIPGQSLGSEPLPFYAGRLAVTLPNAGVWDTVGTLRVASSRGLQLRPGVDLQLEVFRRNPDGTEADIHSAAEGTKYFIPDTDGDVVVDENGVVMVNKFTAPLQSSPTTVRIFIANGDDYAIRALTLLDTDNDGDYLGDAFEAHAGLDSTVTNGPGSDIDHDGLNDLTECLLGTNPTVQDSDGDGLADGCEATLGSNPLSSASVVGRVPRGSVVSVGGQTIATSSFGSFEIANVTAPDLFGAGGPGTPPDLVGDTPVRVESAFTLFGRTAYALSEPFLLRRGVVAGTGPIQVSCTPPIVPASIEMASPTLTFTSIGQTAQLRVTGRMANGSTVDITSHTQWTTYRTSNLSITSVDQDGLVVARGAGPVLITASNGGATATLRLDIAPGDPLTSVEGAVRFGSGLPAVGAVVQLPGLSNSGLTGADGRFVINGVATRLVSPISVAVSKLVGDTTFVGEGSATPVPGGVTDIGVITLTPAVAVFENQLGTLLSQSDDTFTSIPFTGGFSFPFYGQSRTTAFVGSNGYVTFTGGDGTYSESLSGVVSGLPRLSAFFDDLYPPFAAAGGGVFVNQLPGRFVVTWNRVPHFATRNNLSILNTIQMVLFEDGRIQFGYRGISSVATGQGVGITPGGNSPFRTFDFSAGPVAGGAGEALAQMFTAASPFDLDNGFLLFRPNGVGGYDTQFIRSAPIPGVASIVGQVMGENGTLMAGCRVDAVSSTGDVVATGLTTGEDGSFRIDRVPLGVTVSVVASNPALTGVRSKMTGSVRVLQPGRAYAMAVTSNPSATKAVGTPEPPKRERTDPARSTNTRPAPTELTFEDASPIPFDRELSISFGL